MPKVSKKKNDSEKDTVENPKGIHEKFIEMEKKVCTFIAM
jgi:hypothetical protein